MVAQVRAAPDRKTTQCCAKVQCVAARSIMSGKQLEQGL
jgi:hypothetical protein